MNTTSSKDDKFRWLDDLMRSSLHPTTKLVGYELWSPATSDGANSHPGTQTIADNLGISVRSVVTHTKILRDGGWVVRTAKANAKDGRRKYADSYALSFEYRTQDEHHYTQLALRAVRGPRGKPKRPKLR